MATNREYTRLPGRGGSFYRQSLWLGGDHLLAIVNRGYSEDYKRFYYRDVRAIQVRRTIGYLITNVILGTFAAICVAVQALAFFVWDWNEGGQIAFAFLTIVFVVGTLINLLLGPTCVVHLYTAVHTELLPALSRVRTANRALQLLRERIEAVQGMLSQDQAVQTAEVFQTTAPAPAAPKAETPVHDYSGNFHWSLFALLLFNALLVAVNSFQRGAVLQIGALVVYTALGVCMIGALIRQRHSRMGKGLRRLSWASVIYVWFVSVLSSLLMMILMFQGQLKPGRMTYVDMIREMMNMVPAEHPPILVITLFSAACSLGIGLAGLVLMMQYRKEKH